MPSLRGSWSTSPAGPPTSCSLTTGPQRDGHLTKAPSRAGDVGVDGWNKDIQQHRQMGADREPVLSP